MNVVKKYRLLAGLTQGELARRIGAYNEITISKWESGKKYPRPSFIKALMRELQIPADEMIAWLEGAGE